MRRLVLVIAVCALAMLVATPAAATARPAGARQAAGPVARHMRVAGGGPASGAAFVPLGVALGGTATVGGHVYGSGGLATPGVPLEWYATDDGTQWASGDAVADGAGAYSMTTSDGASCWIYAYPGNGDPYLGLGGLSWANGGSYTQDLFPGRVPVTAQRGGRWADFDQLWVYLWNATRDCRGIVYASDRETTPVQGDIDILDGTYTDGYALFYWDEGVEAQGTWTVDSGSASSPMTFDEAQAQRIWFKSPYWYSGKPGAIVKMVFNNFPAGWVNRVGAWTDDPARTIDGIYGDLTATGQDTETVSLKVPSTAKPGYNFWFTVDHVNGLGSLYLNECYQVCSLRATKSGGRVRLSGVIPTQGHWGSDPGISKRVTIYKRTRATSAPPTTWDATKKGWKRLARVRANGLGKFTYRFAKPSRTTWYVVRYPGDDWYYDGYTSVVRVRG